MQTYSVKTRRCAGNLEIAKVLIFQEKADSAEVNADYEYSGSLNG